MSDLIKIRNGIINFLNSGLIFSNGKTDFCVELNICPLMTIEVVKDKEVYKTPLCKACYAATILNIYSGLRKKIRSIPKDKTNLLKTFEEDIKLLKNLTKSTKLGPIKKIRFYGISDFKKDNLPFIFAASKFLTVDIISKTLAMKNNEESLIKLINQPKIWISLSFNKAFKDNLPRIEKLLIEHKAKNVQLNYCLNIYEEDPTDLWYNKFQVIHPTNDSKWNAVKAGLSEKKVCGLWDRDGNKTVNKSGHCKTCNNCHISYLSTIKKTKNNQELAYSN